MVDSTARKPPNTALRCRNHTISSAMATKPERKTATPTSSPTGTREGTARSATTGGLAGTGAGAVVGCWPDGSPRARTPR